jgi:hypothetical protein
MSAFKNDGTVQYGSRVLTVDTIAYVADNCSVTRPGKTIERTNELDEPTGQVSYAGFVTGSATLQLATGSTVIPELGDEFSTTWVTSLGAETFYLDSITQAETNSAEKKINVTFRKKYN